MENSVLTALLQRIDGKYLGVIISLDEFCPADPELALTWFNPVVLHPAGSICRRRIDEVELKRYRGWYISHTIQSINRV